MRVSQSTGRLLFFTTGFALVGAGLGVTAKTQRPICLALSIVGYVMLQIGVFGLGAQAKSMAQLMTELELTADGKPADRTFSEK